MRVRRRALALVSCAAVATATGGWLATSPASATAGEVTRAEVDYRGGRFLVHTEVLIKANENQVRAILTDYAHLDRVNSGIKRIHILPRVHPQQTRMQVVWEMCVLFICLDFNQIQDVEEQDNGDIVATVDTLHTSRS